MNHHPLSEDELVRIIRRTIKNRGRVRFGVGDDAALLKGGTVITTDAYADGVHFDLAYMTPRQVGERCACGAVSDVVAMGAEPEALFVSLALPRAGSEQFAASGPRGRKRRAAGGRRIADDVRELYRGIESVCAEMGCEVAGGDTIVVDRLLLALTVTGRTRTPRFRSGAQPGDGLYVTGHVGSAEAGRLTLEDEVRSRMSNARCRKRDGGERKAKGGLRLVNSQLADWPTVRRHLRPIPRLAVMRTIKSSIHGLIDTSDGLATDAKHLSEMSGVRIVLEADSLPLLPATQRFCAGRGLDPLRFALAAGEDYELLFTSRRLVPSSVNGVNVTRIGRVQAGSGLWIERAGRVLPVAVTGYDHLEATRCRRTCY